MKTWKKSWPAEALLPAKSPPSSSRVVVAEAAPFLKVVPRKTAYKMWLDLAILLAAHLLLLPMWLLLWTVIPLSIWLADRGPVFYRQERMGKNGRVFTILKFRTMIPDADKAGPAWTSEADSRVTRVGKVLRRTALDELPGLLSIIKRDMSLVGPRALAVAEQKVLEKSIPGFEQRLQVLPGLTGLAQVYNDTDDSDSKFHYDLEYLMRMGIRLDIKLILLSIQNTVSGKWDHRAGKPTHPFADRNNPKGGD